MVDKSQPAFTVKGIYMQAQQMGTSFWSVEKRIRNKYN